MPSGSPIVIKLVVTPAKMTNKISYYKKCNSGTNTQGVTRSHIIVKLAKHS